MSYLIKKWGYYLLLQLFNKLFEKKREIFFPEFTFVKEVFSFFFEYRKIGKECFVNSQVQVYPFHYDETKKI